jgi:hypothetical protein
VNTVVAKRKYKYVYVTQRDWKVHTNRVANIVERAIRISDQYLQTHSPAIQHICQEQIRKTTFSWFDTYPGDGQAMEAEPEHFTPVSVNVLERKHTNYLGNKLQLAQTLIEKNINKNVPVTHFSTAQAMAYAQNDRVLFVKNSTGTRGEGVSCIRSTQLPEFELPKNNILQENISNLKLYDERKMVFRFMSLYSINASIFIARAWRLSTDRNTMPIQQTTGCKFSTTDLVSSRTPILFPKCQTTTIGLKKLWMRQKY